MGETFDGDDFFELVHLLNGRRSFLHYARLINKQTMLKSYLNAFSHDCSHFLKRQTQISNITIWLNMIRKENTRQER